MIIIGKFSFNDCLVADVTNRTIIMFITEKKLLTRLIMHISNLHSNQINA